MRSRFGSSLCTASDTRACLLCPETSGPAGIEMLVSEGEMPTVGRIGSIFHLP